MSPAVGLPLGESQVGCGEAGSPRALAYLAHCLRRANTLLAWGGPALTTLQFQVLFPLCSRCSTLWGPGPPKSCVARMTLPSTQPCCGWDGTRLDPQLETGEEPSMRRWGIHGLEARNVGVCHSHLSISWDSVVSTGPLFPSAWNSNCGHLPRLACVCVDTLGPGVQHGRQDKGMARYPSPECTCKSKEI